MHKLMSRLIKHRCVWLDLSFICNTLLMDLGQELIFRRSEVQGIRGLLSFIRGSQLGVYVFWIALFILIFGGGNIVLIQHFYFYGVDAMLLLYQLVNLIH